MPERWRVVIDHPDPAGVERAHLHALVARWLDEDHWASPKPYCLVPLYEWVDGLSAFEVGGLIPEVGPALAAGVAAFHEQGGRLGQQRCRAVDREAELVASATWEQLWEEARSRRTIRLRFETPTTFRAGRVSQPLPLASSVVRSWSSRWARHASPALAAEVPLDASRLAIAVDKLDGRTVEVQTPGRPLIAFVGEVGYRNHERGETGRSVGRRLDALACVAEFSGTGSSTTAGLGVTAYHRDPATS